MATQPTKPGLPSRLVEDPRLPGGEAADRGYGLPLGRPPRSDEQLLADLQKQHPEATREELVEYLLEAGGPDLRGLGKSCKGALPSLCLMRHRSLPPQWAFRSAAPPTGL